MAVSLANLTSGTGESAGNITTASITPTASNLVLLSIAARRGDSTEPTTPTVSGNGLTWELVNSIYFDTSATSMRKLFLFRAMGASPSAGVVTINFGATTNATWVIDQASGIDTSGTNGSGAIVQSATNKDESVTTSSFSVTLGAFSSTNNATYGVFAEADGSHTVTPGSGFTELDEQANGFTPMVMQTQWISTNDTGVDWTSSGSVYAGGVAVEIKADTTNLTIRSSSSNSSTTGTAISVTAPTGTSVGDLVIVSVHGNGQTTIADNNGATPFTEDINDYQPNTTSGHTVSIFSRVIQSGDPTTYNFTLGASGRWSIVTVCFINPQASYYDVSPSTTNAANRDNSTSSTLNAPAITIGVANSIDVVCGYSDDGVGGAMTGPAGYAVQAQPVNEPQVVLTKTVSTGTTGTRQVTATTTSPMIALSFSIKAAASASAIKTLAAMGVG